MELKTKLQKVNLVYRTRKIVNIAKLLDGKNFEELYFNALTENNVEALSNMILAFAEDPENGASAFKNIDEVFDFLDDYMEENKKTYQDIFKDLAESINNAGFFNKKMTKEELTTKAETHLSIDMNKIIQSSAEKAIQQVAENEMFLSRG